MLAINIPLPKCERRRALDCPGFWRCASNVAHILIAAAGSHPSFSRWPWSSGTLQTSASLDKMSAPEGRPPIQPSEAFVAGPARQATGSRFRISLTLAHTCQCRTINIEPLHHFMHASRLSFDTARHPPAHADLPVPVLLHRASIAYCQRHRWSGRSSNSHPSRPERRPEPNRARSGATPCTTHIRAQGLWTSWAPHASQTPDRSPTVAVAAAVTRTAHCGCDRVGVSRRRSIPHQRRCGSAHLAGKPPIR